MTLSGRLDSTGITALLTDIAVPLGMEPEARTRSVRSEGTEKASQNPFTDGHRSGQVA